MRSTVNRVEHVKELHRRVGCIGRWLETPSTFALLNS